MAKLVKKLSLKQGDTKEEFYFDATTGVKGYDLYSEDEMLVGKWKNGKPIYKKTFTGTIAGVDSVSSKIFKNISDIPIDSVVKIEGLVDYDANEKLPLPYPCPGGTCCDVHVKYPNMMYFNNISWMVGKPFNATVYYTKTTDQPDSFVEEKVELTAEHKTGETFNGKDVYEKTFVKILGSSDGNDTFATVPELNIEDVIDITSSTYNTSGTSVSSVANNYSHASNNLIECYYNFPSSTIYAYHIGTYYRGVKCIVNIKYTKK